MIFNSYTYCYAGHVFLGIQEFVKNAQTHARTHAKYGTLEKQKSIDFVFFKPLKNAINLGQRKANIK
uniref:Uncharacterized protein n=1 Tax=Glossina palpalis gambiensis TaxID=67801 RepID=A0A1B0AVM1_9MUSC